MQHIYHIYYDLWEPTFEIRVRARATVVAMVSQSLEVFRSFWEKLESSSEFFEIFISYNWKGNRNRKRNHYYKGPGKGARVFPGGSFRASTATTPG